MWSSSLKYTGGREEGGKWVVEGQAGRERESERASEGEHFKRSNLATR